MVNLRQMRDLVIEPTLKQIGLHSPEATDLILFTGVQESGYRYLKQMGAGPALSFWQVEPTTLEDHFTNYLDYRIDLRDEIWRLTVPDVELEEQLIWNLPLGVAMCRLKYRRSPMKLPDVGDGEGMAHIWKVAYNTLKGRGTELEFISSWEKHKQEIL